MPADEKSLHGPFPPVIMNSKYLFRQVQEIDFKELNDENDVCIIIDAQHLSNTPPPSARNEESHIRISSGA